jgi:membrane protein YdbS with pleckstrin-like domain
MSNRRKRRNTAEPKKPVSMQAYAAAGVAVVSLAVCAGVLVWSYVVAGNTPKIAAGISMVAFIAAICSFFVGTSTFRNQTYNKKSRYVGLIFSTMAFVVWIVIYVAGLVIG